VKAGKHVAVAIGLGLMTVAAWAKAGDAVCDRACLRSLADQLVTSIIAHDPGRLSLSPEYAATENGQPAALPMMTLWRTMTSAESRYYVIDPVSRQVFLIVTLKEGGNDSLLFGRIKIDSANRLAELELYIDRSRANGGFQFDAEGPSHFPDAWTVAITPAQRASRTILLQAGRSVFDMSVAGLPIGSDCLLMENGKVVGENPEVMKQVVPPGTDLSKLRFNADGSVAIPCGLPAGRPTDAHARTDIVDEEAGIVVSLAVVPGMVEPYVINTPTDSAFVPDAMLKPYLDMLGKQLASGKYKAPRLRPMPATLAVAELLRIDDGKVQGMMMLQNMAPVGAGSAWISGD
jgi:hypothetical protein